MGDPADLAISLLHLKSFSILNDKQYFYKKAAHTYHGALWNGHFIQVEDTLSIAISIFFDLSSLDRHIFCTIQIIHSLFSWQIQFKPVLKPLASTLLNHFKSCSCVETPCYCSKYLPQFYFHNIAVKVDTRYLKFYTLLAITNHAWLQSPIMRLSKEYLG